MVTPRPETTFAVMLYFDAVTEGVVLELRAALDQAGVPPIPKLFDGRPHVSLVVAAAPTPDPLTAAVAAFAGKVPPLPIRFEAVASFAGSGNILYLAPTSTRALLEHHAAFYGSVERLAVEPWERYLPGRWIPHCTLAMGVPEELLGQAFAVARGALQPVAGRLVEIGVVSLPPARTVSLFPLSG